MTEPQPYGSVEGACANEARGEQVRRVVRREAVERGARAYVHKRQITNAPESLARAVLEAAAPTLLTRSEDAVLWADAVSDVLVDYNVPADRIITDARKLLADPDWRRA